MKTIVFFFVIVIGGMLYLMQTFQNGTALRYIDQHPQNKGVPEATYYIGQTYYLFQNLPEATTYFLRVAQRYPDNALADDAYFCYLQCLDDLASASRSDLIEGYQAYLDKYPNGKHAEVVKNRLDNYRTGPR